MNLKVLEETSRLILVSRVSEFLAIVGLSAPVLMPAVSWGFSVPRGPPHLLPEGPLHLQIRNGTADSSRASNLSLLYVWFTPRCKRLMVR